MREDLVQLPAKQLVPALCLSCTEQLLSAARQGPTPATVCPAVQVVNPLGRRFVTRSTPGVTKASMLAALPDVGAGMDGRTVRFQMRFVRSAEEGGIVADRWDHSSHKVMQMHRSGQGWDVLDAAHFNLNFP